MAILRCGKCGHLVEVSNDAVGTAMPCPKCENKVPVYDTVIFVGKVLEKYFAQQNELIQLRNNSRETNASATASKVHVPIADVDIHNTSEMSSDFQHGPIHEWFQRSKIEVRPNLKAVDTTGFFDEVALSLGNRYDLLKEVSEMIRFAQQKGYTSINIHLSKKSQKDAQAITTFCQQLYAYSFFARYNYQREEKVIRLTLQTAPAIQEFFGGEWMEWYAFMTMLAFLRDRKREFSCARNLSVIFPNEDLHELDVFFLVDGNKPVCVECKTGEFRQSIDKYLVLRKRLGIQKSHFILCVAALVPEHAVGLSSMYDITFVSESQLVSHLAKLF